MIILDTQALLWVDQDDPSLGPDSRAAVTDALNLYRLGISTMSFWEVEALLRSALLTMELDLTAWRRNLLRAGIIELYVDGIVGFDGEQITDTEFLATAKLAVSIRESLDNPRDRLLGDTPPTLLASLIVASAIRADATLVTTDPAVLGWSGDLKRMDARQ